MEFGLSIKMNKALYLRNPEDSPIGKKIVRNGLLLMNRLGYENFTFKKLAVEIQTTEATIYKYFENKHRLLTYIMSWYWSVMEYHILFQTNHLQKPEIKLKTIIKLLCEKSKENRQSDELNITAAYELLMREGSKTYLTHHVTSDNRNKLFKAYKDLCAHFATTILEYQPKYKYPHTLATTIIETSHSQKYFMQYLPSLTDFKNIKEEKKLQLFLENLLFNALK